MHYFRITKYNPKYRNELGHYTMNDWTSFSDIGKLFDGKLLSYADYENVEASYISAILMLLKRSKVKTLKIAYIENHLESVVAPKKNDVFDLNRVVNVFKSVLRNEYWCTLISEDENVYVHFGYDFYMYISVPIASKNSIDKIESSGLFVEDMISPYLNIDNDE